MVPVSGTTIAHAQPIHAQPAHVQPVSARIDHVERVGDRQTKLFVHSAAMNRVVPVQVLHPASAGPRPTLYLLDGVSAGEESEFRESTWTQRTDIAEFFADKNTNVVLPVGGTASYYTDWNNPDPVLGINKWETFLTEELPPLIDAEFDGNGTNAVAGLSMGATGAMSLITRNPDLYQGVAALSGCYDISSDRSRDTVRGTVAYKGGNPDNMWGPPDDARWEEHDSYLLAEKLRGKEVFLSTGNGLLGPHDLAPVRTCSPSARRSRSAPSCAPSPTTVASANSVSPRRSSTARGARIRGATGRTTSRPRGRPSPTHSDSADRASTAPSQWRRMRPTAGAPRVSGSPDSC